MILKHKVNSSEKEKKAPEYEGACLCNETTFMARGHPSNPHLCSCSMCQKSSGALTVAWVEFPLDTFKWTGKRKPALYQSSDKIQRCFCENCGSLLGTLNEGYPNVCITIATLKTPTSIIPTQHHSYKENAPSWWKVKILNIQ